MGKTTIKPYWRREHAMGTVPGYGTEEPGRSADATACAGLKHESG